MTPARGYASEVAVAAHPVLFSIAFRRKMAELSAERRREWLASVAAKIRLAGARIDPVVEQELREVARGCRLLLVDSVDRNLGPFDPRHLEALLEVARERFVRPDDVERSAEDVPLALDAAGLASISAPHAYLLSYRLLGLEPGDALVELGSGSGYGAALAAFVVGAEGRVVTFEIDKDLAALAGRCLEDRLGGVRVVQLDAMVSTPEWGGAKKVSVTFAVESLPPIWLEALPDGGRLVAPVGPQGADQRLILVTKRAGHTVQADHGAVRYVSNRSAL
jgi:protein-L-isoaspartate(D-aspartate) O-methyltransferase